MKNLQNFLFLTNSSARTLRELSQKLARMGLSGVTHREDLPTYAYQPDYVLDGVGDIVPV